jgi:hypothetical protein
MLEDQGHNLLREILFFVVRGGRLDRRSHFVADTSFAAVSPALNAVKSPKSKP